MFFALVGHEKASQGHVADRGQPKAVQDLKASPVPGVVLGLTAVTGKYFKHNYLSILVLHTYENNL